MKIFNFTFLFFIFVNLTLFISTGAAENCFATCPDVEKTAAGFQCFAACKARNNAAPKVTTTTKSTAATKRTPTKSTPKPSTTTSSGKEASEPQSSSPQLNCGAKEYPNLLSCEQCPGNGTKIVGGQVYCRAEEAPKDESPEAACNADIDSQSCIAYRDELCKRGDSAKSYDAATRECKKTEDGSEAESHACIEQFNSYKDKCISEASSAETSCNDENESMKAATNSAKVVGAGSAVSVQMACSKLGEVAKLANGALVGWQSYCAANQGGCEESCREAKRILESNCINPSAKEVLSGTFLGTIRTNIQQCESYKVKIAEAAQHAAAALAQMKAAKQCEDDTSSTLQTNNLDQCKTNPNSPLCADMQKCSNATFAAQNPVCTCVANPTSPSCLQAAASYQAGGLSSGANISGTKNGKETGLNGLDPNANATDASNPLAGLGNAPSGDGQSVGGRQGDASSAGRANSNGGGGGGAGGGNYGAGGGGEKDALKVNSGTLGGGTMGSGFFGKNNGGGGGSYGQMPNNGRRDIAKFDPRKYITGQGGKGEYINGANENIFKIVKMRYEDKKTTLLPETFSLKK